MFLYFFILFSSGISIESNWTKTGMSHRNESFTFSESECIATHGNVVGKLQQLIKQLNKLVKHLIGWKKLGYEN